MWDGPADSRAGRGRQGCAELAETRAEIVRWVAGLIGFQTLAIIGAVVALARALH